MVCACFLYLLTTNRYKNALINHWRKTNAIWFITRICYSSLCPIPKWYSGETRKKNMKLEWKRQIFEGIKSSLTTIKLRFSMNNSKRIGTEKERRNRSTDFFYFDIFSCDTFLCWPLIRRIQIQIYLDSCVCPFYPFRKSKIL